jgi:hypothetical protein
MAKARNIYLLISGKSTCFMLSASHRICCWLSHPYGSLCMTKKLESIKESFAMNLFPSSGINLAIRHYAARLTFVKHYCSSNSKLHSKNAKIK